MSLDRPTRSIHLFQPDRMSEVVCFVLPREVPGEPDPLSIYKLCIDMHVNKIKFEQKSSREYYHMTCIGKTKHTS